MTKKMICLRATECTTSSRCKHGIPHDENVMCNCTDSTCAKCIEYVEKFFYSADNDLCYYYNSIKEVIWNDTLYEYDNQFPFEVTIIKGKKVYNKLGQFINIDLDRINEIYQDTTFIDTRYPDWPKEKSDSFDNHMKEAANKWGDDNNGHPQEHECPIYEVERIRIKVLNENGDYEELK